MNRDRYLILLIVFVPPLVLVGLLLDTLLRGPGLSPREPANAVLELPSAASLPKIEIDSSKLILAPAGSGLSLKASDSTAGDVAAIPAGTRLVAILDNNCLDTRAEQRSSGQMKSIGLTLAEKAYAASEKERVDELSIQAYAYDAADTLLVSALTLEAEADPCVRQITDEKIRRLNWKSSSATVATMVNDPSIISQIHLDAIAAAPAWTLFHHSGLAITKDVVIAIIDSGVDYNHEDLSANMWHAPGGEVGYDFVNHTTTPMDDLGHGTHVAGLIAAVSDNSKGVSGVMGKHAKIMAVKVINASDEGTMSDFVNGLRYAADRGANVINLSLGGEETTTSERDAIAYAAAKGAVIITAAGNEGKLMTTTDNDYPSGYAATTPGMIAVGSIDVTTGNRSTFSNYSTNYIYLAAPGAESAANAKGLLSTSPNNTYRRMMGTSMAAPLVTGAAALVIGALKTNNIGYRNSEIVDLILNSAKREPALESSFKNGAVLDLESLARATRSRYLIDGDAGTEEAP